MRRHEEFELDPPTVSGLTVVASLCGAGSCPTVYRAAHGALVIQGRAVDAGSLGIDLPDGEALVEIPEQLLAALAEPGDGPSLPDRPPA